MMTGDRYRAWMQAHTELRLRLDAGDLGAAREGVAQLKVLATGVAADGLDLAEVCRITGSLAEADLLIMERRFGEAERILESATPRVPIDAARSAYLRANVLLGLGNTALAQDAIEKAANLFRQAEDVAPREQVLIRANALFNLGNCLVALSSEEPDNNVLLEDALKTFGTAAEFYESIELLSKVADCIHMAGNVRRFEGKFNAATELHLKAAQIYQQASNHRGNWMATDDASRAMLLYARELGDTPDADRWLQMALDTSIIATVASNTVWASAGDNENLRNQLSVELESHLVNRIEIALAKAPLLVHTALAHHKGRVRATRPASVELVASLVDDEPTRAAVRDGIAPALSEPILAGLRRLTVATERIAVLDQFCIFGRNMVTAVHIVDNVNVHYDIVITELDESVPDRPAHEEPRFRSAGRASPAVPVIDRMMEELRRSGERAMMLLQDNPTPTNDEEREQLRDWASALGPDARILGKWFFSPELIEFLSERSVGHAVLIPDPHYVHVPYLMLESGGKQIAEQPWSLSVSASVLDLCATAAKYPTPTPVDEIVWLAPDRDVNEHRGGDQERAALEETVALRAVTHEAATVEAAAAVISNGGWLHFRGHGRWDGPPQHRGPICADAVLTVQRLQAAGGAGGGTMVTIACGTGFGTVVGTESFGSLADLGAAGLRSAVLTLWPIAGDSATPFSAELYRCLARWFTLATAFRVAILSTRELLPHPFFWSCFSLVGAWSSRWHVAVATKQVSAPPDRST